MPKKSTKTKSTKKTKSPAAGKQATPPKFSRKAAKKRPQVQVEISQLDMTVDEQKNKAPQKETATPRFSHKNKKPATPKVEISNLDNTAIVPTASCPPAIPRRQKQIVVIALALVVLAGVYFWTRPLPRDTAPTPTEQISDQQAADEYLATLEKQTSWVLLQTSSFVSQDETSDGQSYAITETLTHKLSITPDLVVSQELSSSASADLDHPEVAKLIAQANTSEDAPPAYTKYDRAKKETTYYNNYDGQWTYTTDATYVSQAPYRYAQLWETSARPVLIGPGLLQARDADNFGTYTFHFDPQTKKLTFVDYVTASGGPDVYYQVLDEAPITKVPSDVINGAVPFKAEEVYSSDLIPTVGGQAYVPEDL